MKIIYIYLYNINIYIYHIYGTPLLNFQKEESSLVELALFGGVGSLCMSPPSIMPPSGKLMVGRLHYPFAFLAYFQGELTFSVREGNGNQHLYKVGPYQL